MAIWNILWPFGTLGNLAAIWYIYPRFGIGIVSRKIWQPLADGARVTRWGEISPIGRLFKLGSFFNCKNSASNKLFP
jgi:hypothetical protein